MPGFFSLENHRATKPLGCASCGLSRKCLSPCMPPSGSGKVPILFLAEAPGQEEDKQNTQLVGAAGAELRTALRSLGVRLDDCLKFNSVNCRPPANRTPKPTEIAACRRYVTALIEERRPRVIVPLGSTAISSLLEHRLRDKPGALSVWQGLTIPDVDLGAWVCPTFHPSFVLRMGHDPVVKNLWAQDLERALSLTSERGGVGKDSLDAYKARITRIAGEQQAVEFLRKVLRRKPPIIGVDFETTGLKPDREGHQIASCAIAIPNGTATAFLTNTPKILEALREVLVCREIGKAIWNLQFEQRWAKAILGVWIQNVAWDGLLAAHVIDCRRKYTGLKRQVYVQLGIIDYNSTIEPYLKAKDSNSFNRVLSAPVFELLMYNGLDALFTLEIARKQKKGLTRCR